MEGRVKPKEEAPDFVQKSLWPLSGAFGHKKLSPSAEKLLEEENEKFFFSKVLSDGGKRMYRDGQSFLVKDTESLKALFQSGRTRNEKEQILVIHGFQVS